MSNTVEIFPTNKDIIKTNINLSGDNTSVKVFGSDVIIEQGDEVLVILYGAVFISLGNSLTVQDSSGSKISLSELIYSPNTVYEFADDSVSESDKVSSIIVRSRDKGETDTFSEEQEKPDSQNISYSDDEVVQIIDDVLASTKSAKELKKEEQEEELAKTAKSLDDVIEEINQNNTNYKFDEPPVEEKELKEDKLYDQREVDTSSFNEQETRTNEDITSPIIPSWVLDSDSGVIGDDTTNNTNPTIRGDFIVDSQIAISVTKNDVNVANYEVPVTSDGAWEQVVDLSNNDGTYEIRATYTDAQSIQHFFSDNVVLDTVTNNPVWTLDDNTNSGVTTDNITNNLTPTIKGSAEANATITVFKGIGSSVTSLGTTTARDDGTWEFTIPNNELVEGSNALTVRTRDISGNDNNINNTVAESSGNIIIDTIAPQEPVISAIGGFNNPVVSLNRGLHVIEGTGEAGATVELFLDNVSVGTQNISVNGDWDFGFNTNLLAEGEHTLSAKAIDIAFNESGIASRDIAIVGTIFKPTIMLSADSDTGFRTDETMEQQVTYEGTVALGATVKLFREGDTNSFASIVDSDNDGAWSYTETSPLSEGEHTIMAQAQSSNNSALSDLETLTYTIDITPPTGITIDNASTTVNIFSSESVEITGTGTAGNRFYYEVLNNSNTSIFSSNLDGVIRVIEVDSTYGFSIEPNIFPSNGFYSVRVIEVDGAGNESISLGAPFINLDVNDTIFTITTAGNDNTPSFTVNTDANTTIEVSILDSVGTSVYSLTDTITSSGDYVFELSQSERLSDGDYRIEVTTQSTPDASGDRQMRNFTDPFTIDTLAPSAASGVAIADVSAGITADLSIDTTPTIIGNAEAGATVRLTVNSTTYDSDLVNSSGAWQITTSTLANGSYSADIDVIDAAGNSSPSEVYNFSVQDHIVADLDKNNIKLQADNNEYPSYSNDVNPVFTGVNAVPDSFVVAELDADGDGDGDGEVGVATVGSDGSWSLDIAATVTDGDRTILLFARDEYGNISDNAVDFPITIDRVPPSTTSVTVENYADSVDDKSVTDGMLSLSGFISDDLSSFF